MKFSRFFKVLRSGFSSSGCTFFSIFFEQKLKNDLNFSFKKEHKCQNTSLSVDEGCQKLLLALFHIGQGVKFRGQESILTKIRLFNVFLNVFSVFRTRAKGAPFFQKTVKTSKKMNKFSRFSRRKHNFLTKLSIKTIKILYGTCQNVSKGGFSKTTP